MGDTKPARQEYIIARMHDVSLEYMGEFVRVFERMAKRRKSKVFMRPPTDGTAGVEFVEIVEEDNV